MKPHAFLRTHSATQRLLAFLSTQTLCLLLALSQARADTLVWDTNTGTDGAQDGSGTWTATGGNWFNSSAIPVLQNQTWTNGYDAVFGANSGAAGTVTINGSITAGNLTFNAAGSSTYTLGGTGTLTLNNATITANANAAISAILAGTTPWIKTGTGVLTLNGSTSNTFNGLLTVNQGTLTLAKPNGFTAVGGNLAITNGAFVILNGSVTNQIASGAAVTLSGQASVFNGTGPNAGNGSSLTQTLSSLTINGGTFNTGAGANWTISGAFSMTGGTTNAALFVGNSSVVMTVGSLSLVDMNGTSSAAAVTNGFTLFGNGTSGTTRMTVGTGGMNLQNSNIFLGAGSTGSLLYLNGDVSTSGAAGSTIQVTGTGALSPFLGLGTTGTVSRTFNIASGADLTINVAINNGTATSASLVKTGTGTLLLNGSTANTFTGDAIVNAGTLRLNKTANINGVGGNIIVNTGGTLQLSANNQIDDTKGITLNGGTLAGFSTDETLAFFTQNSGGLASSGNTGHMIITGALTLSGGTVLTINSNATANPASWTAGSAILTGADILVGGNNNAGNPRTALTIGSGGLTIAGRTITLNVGTAGVVLNLNGDITSSGNANILNGGGSGVQPLIAIGSATRTVNVLNNTLTISAEINGTGGSLTKTGSGLLQLTTSNTYTGVTTASGGTLSLAGTGGFLTGTTSLVINNGGILQNGSSTVINNNSIANRINTASTLTLGGGTFSQINAATGSHTQSLASLSVTSGTNTVSVSTLAGTTNTLTFSGASPYSRTAGSVNFVQTPASGSSIIFTNAPTGVGGVLAGATLNGTDLVAAQAGVLTAYTGWVPTGTSTWTTAAAMDVTGSNSSAYASTNVTAIRFNTAGSWTLNLAGTHIINAGIILMTPSASTGASLISGGTLQGTTGSDLVLAQYNTTGSLEISSVIADNTTASGIVKSGAGLVILSGSNTYTGITRIGEGTLRAADGVGLPSTSALLLSGGAFETTTGSFTRSLGAAAGQVTLTGASAGFSAAGIAATVNIGGAAATLVWDSTNFNTAALILNAASATAALELVNGIDLNGSGRSIRVDANTATISSLITNSVSGSPATLTKLGAGTLRLTQANTYDGGTVISGGLIAVGSNQSLGAGTITLAGGGLQADGAARTLTNNVVLTAASTVTSALNLTLSGTFTNSGASSSLTTSLSGGAVLELSGNVFLSESATLSRTLNIFGSGDRLISGVVANNAGDNTLGSNLFYNGGGTLTLSGLNTYTGRTLAAGGGYIVISQDRNLGIASATPMVDSLILANNGRIRASSSFTLDANRGIGIGNSSGGAAIGQIDVNNNIVFTVAGVVADRTLNQDGTAVTAANTGALTKTGTGILALSGNNTYTGLTSVSNGFLQLNSNNALGSTAAGTTVTSNGHVILGDGVKITGEFLTLSNSAGSVFGSTQNTVPTTSRGTLQAGVNAKAEWAGDILFTTDFTRIGVQEGGTLTISGSITDGASNLTLRLSGELTGTGGVILSGTANAWDGGTDIVRGKVILGVNNTLPSTTALDIHFTNTNNTEYAGVEMNGFSQIIASLRNSGSSGSNAEITNSSRTLSMLTVNETGNVTYGGIITGNLNLIKSGTGTLVLSQANRLTGGITLSDGVLRSTIISGLAFGDVTIDGGKLDVSVADVAADAINGIGGTITNDNTASTTTRTFSMGASHGSGSYGGLIVDNTGGGAIGKLAIAKIGAGTQILSGTNTYTGGTFVSNGTLYADYFSGGTPLSNGSITLQGGTLTIGGASSASLASLTLVQSGADFTSSTLRIEGSATVTVGSLTANSFAPLMVDIREGGTLVVSTLSSATVTNGVLMGASGRATLFVRDTSGLGFATRDVSNQIVRYTGATVLNSSSAATANTTNYLLGDSLARTAALNFQTLQINTSGSDITLNMGTSNIAVGSGRTILVTGSNNVTISATTGVITGGSIFVANYGTGETALSISAAGQAFVNVGTGLVSYSNAANLADLYAAGGITRITGDRDYSTNVIRIYGGGVLEIGADLNGSAAGAFTRAVGQADGQVALVGNAGFSAFGADRVVALGGTASPTALTWGNVNFLAGPGGDNSYTFLLGSAKSTHTVEFQNAIALGSRERRIEVADGTSSTNTDARLTGVLSGAGGSVIKEGTGRLEFTAANTYTGTTQVNAGSLLLASTGKTGTGAVSVASGATLLGTGTIQGSSFTLASSASLHAGSDTAAGTFGTLTFQTTAKASYLFQTSSAITLDIQSANNQLTLDASFGGNAIGSAGYNAYVDAFSGTGSGSHDVLTFDAAAGSTLNFSGNIVVRGSTLNAAVGQVFNLVDWTSLVSTDFSSFNVGTNYRTGADDNGLQFDLPALTGGLLWDISRFTTSGVIVVVPEPSRALLALTGVLLLALRRRRSC